MTQNTDSCRPGNRLSGGRTHRAARSRPRRTRLRVATDTVVAAYIQDISRPRTDGSEHEPSLNEAVHEPRRVEYA